MALIREILNNEYYQKEVKPALNIESTLDNLVNLDVVDVKSFFLREQVIGELRTYVRLEELLERRAEELQVILNQQTNKDIDENE